jgi:hypothetical protein
MSYQFINEQNPEKNKIQAPYLPSAGSSEEVTLQFDDNIHQLVRAVHVEAEAFNRLHTLIPVA